MKNIEKTQKEIKRYQSVKKIRNKLNFFADNYTI